MKNKVLPMILMIWPYIYLLNMVFPEGTMLYDNFTTIYIALTVLVYGINIWNAFGCYDANSTKDYAFWNMIIKLFHIPFYLGVFVLGAVFLLAMAVPALILISPIIAMTLAGIDYMLMITSSVYGIRTITLLVRNKEISKRMAILYVVLHLIFVLDVLAAIKLYKRTKSVRQGKISTDT